MNIHNGATKRDCPISGSYTPFVGIAGGKHNELDISKSISESVTGHGGGGTQVRESQESWQSSRSAAGLAEHDSLQHNFNRSQSSSEKPRDLAEGGFSSCPPDVTVYIN